MLHYLLRYTTLPYVTHAIYMLYFYRLFPGCLTVDTQGTSPRESLATCAEILLLIFDILFWKNVPQEFRCVQRAIVVLSLCFRPFRSKQEDLVDLVTSNGPLWHESSVDLCLQRNRNRWTLKCTQ